TTGREKPSVHLLGGRILDLGAVWQIRYYQDSEGHLYLDRVTFTGELNYAINTAANLVKKYYEMLALRMYTEAYGLLSQQEKSHTNMINLSQNSDTFDTFSQNSDTLVAKSPHCTDIKVVSHAKDKVIVQADIGCLKKPAYAYASNNDNYYQCEVIKV